MRDHFPDFRPHQMDDKLNSRGNTLRQQLLIDRRDPTIKMGCIYYAEQRMTFDDESSPLKLLKAVDKTEPMHPLVKKSIEGLEANP